MSVATATSSGEDLGLLYESTALEVVISNFKLVKNLSKYCSVHNGGGVAFYSFSNTSPNCFMWEVVLQRSEDESDLEPRSKRRGNS
jgi:hypothetical protein